MLKQKIFLGINIFILLIFGVEIFNGYMGNHTYYFSMMRSRNNWGILIRAIISGFIPISYLIRSKKISLNKFVWTLFGGLSIFSVAHTALKESIVGMGGLIVLILNTLIIFSIGIYFILGILSLGGFISNKIFNFKEIKRQQIFINFGIGLGVFLLFIRLLIISGLFYGIIIRLIFISFAIFIYIQKKELKTKKEEIENILSSEFSLGSIKRVPISIVGIVLLLLSIMYYLYGFNLSFIPYSTARDANHAYMYIPKIRTLNNGVLPNIDGQIGLVETRHTFIAFWFALINPIKSRFWIAPDTFAVALNFLSGVFVILFSVGLLSEFLNFFNPKNSLQNNNNIKKLGLYVGRTVLLLWLTSGMGAFLVFVDNKTDLGVMALSCLAILSGFMILQKINEEDKNTKKLNKTTILYLLFSGFMFSLANLAKPTAMVDIFLFGCILIGIRFKSTIGIGSAIFTIGFLGIVQYSGMQGMISSYSNLPIIFIIIGLILIIVGIYFLIIKNISNKKEINFIKKKGLYIGIRGFSIILLFVLLKGPIVIYNNIKLGNFDIMQISKTILLSSNDDSILLNSQRIIDSNYSKQNIISPEQCNLIKYSEEELSKGLKEAPTSNEDRGRYVGYGRKTFEKPNHLFRLGYGLLRIFYNQENTCYSANKDAKILCQNKNKIDNFDIEGIKQMLIEINPKSEPYQLIQNAIINFESGGYDAKDPKIAQLMRSDVVLLRQYYQTHSVFVDLERINVPYRYITFLNIAYNRSLQNLSSYYTDIGFVWIFVFIFTTLSLIYYIITKEKNKITYVSITILGRIIRRLIADGIVRYGIGLFIWTFLLLSQRIIDLLKNNDTKQDDNKTYLIYGFLFFIILRTSIQLIFNFIRISSQGASGPFSWYKMNAGKSIIITERLEQKEEVKYGYNQQNVFDLQFPHYNKFIKTTKNRSDEEGIMIAGTYLQYFLDNQKNLHFDGMLNRFRETTSDNDSCKSYQRLKNKGIKHIVIDPNIGTVVMGEGNETLFQRFFAKRNPINGLIEDHGTISMLVKLWKEGYIKLFSTNNIGAKYAFEIKDEDFRKAFGDITDDEIHFIRSQLSIARFFQNGQQLLSFIYTTFLNRVQNGLAIGDIADILGKDVNSENIMKIIIELGQKKIIDKQLEEKISQLSQDERYIMLQYLVLYNALQNRSEDAKKMIEGIIGQSLNGTSQIIIFQLL